MNMIVHEYDLSEIVEILKDVKELQYNKLDESDIFDLAHRAEMMLIELEDMEVRQ